MINGIWKHPLETRAKRMECYWVLILFLKIGVFFFLQKFLPPPFLTAKYSFLNTGIFCSGNSTGEIFFQLDFFPYSAWNAVSLSAVSPPYILSAGLSKNWLYTISEEFFSSWSLLTYTCCHQTQHTASDPAYIRTGTCSRKYLQDTNLKSGKQTDIPTKENLPFLLSLFFLPKQQSSKQNFWDAQFPL